MPIRVINDNRSRSVLQHLDWCNECFGPGPKIESEHLAEKYRWCYKYTGFGIYVFYFQSEADYMFYLLRWP